MTGYSFDLRIIEVHDQTSQHKTICRPRRDDALVKRRNAAVEAPRVVLSYVEHREGGSDGQISW
jgi:hypothetical protein